MIRQVRKGSSCRCMQVTWGMVLCGTIPIAMNGLLRRVHPDLFVVLGCIAMMLIAVLGSMLTD